VSACGGLEERSASLRSRQKKTALLSAGQRKNLVFFGLKATELPVLEGVARSSSHALGVTVLESRRRRDGPQGRPLRPVLRVGWSTWA